MNKSEIFNKWTDWNGFSLNGFAVPPPRLPRLSKSSGKRKVKRYLEENHNSAMTYMTLVPGMYGGYEACCLTTEQTKRMRKSVFPVPNIKIPYEIENIIDYRLNIEYAFDFIEKEFVKSIIDGKAFLNEFERETTYQEIFDPFMPLSDKRRRRLSRYKRKRVKSVESVTVTTPVHCSSSSSDENEVLKENHPKFSNQDPNAPKTTCSCKKSECLKLYCDCFRAGLFCGEHCGCTNCSNKDFDAMEQTQPIVTPEVVRVKSRSSMGTTNTVGTLSSINTFDLLQTPPTRQSSFFSPTSETSKSLSFDSEKAKKRRQAAITKILRKNPEAFQSKVNPEEKLHRVGCNCKKSGCLKKYCECFSNGVGCGDHCRCTNCKNPYDSQ